MQNTSGTHSSYNYTTYSYVFPFHIRTPFSDIKSTMKQTSISAIKISCCSKRKGNKNLLPILLRLLISHKTKVQGGCIIIIRHATLVRTTVIIYNYSEALLGCFSVLVLFVWTGSRNFVAFF